MINDFLPMLARFAFVGDNLRAVRFLVLPYGDE